jgi:anti-sigma factor RsiW
MSERDAGGADGHEEPTLECAECGELMELIAEYLDNRETVEMRRVLAEHAANCDHCARLLWAMRRVVGTCRSESSPEIPGEVHARLWQVLVEEFRVECDRQDEA